MISTADVGSAVAIDRHRPSATGRVRRRGAGTHTDFRRCSRGDTTTCVRPKSAPTRRTLFSTAVRTTVGWGNGRKLGIDIGRLTEWASDTDTGDRDDWTPVFRRPRGGRCRHRRVTVSVRPTVDGVNECFAEAARERARSADIVITNHALLSIDLMHNRTILPDHSLLIVDEAHELADRTTSAARAELSASSLDRFVASVDEDLRR